MFIAPRIEYTVYTGKPFGNLSTYHARHFRTLLAAKEYHNRMLEEGYCSRIEDKDGVTITFEQQPEHEQQELAL